MALKTKICGITNLEDARFCAGAGADYLGFVQYPGSPRYVAPEQARDIIAWVYGPEAVGVFVNEEAEVVNRVAEAAGFALVQLHGTEPPSLCAQIERPVVKALRVVPDATAEALRAQVEPYRAHVALFLFDTYHPQHWGGTGTSFNWHALGDLSDDVPFLLAGGIGPANVAEAVRAAHPFGVDLSSSLEATPGKKDFDLVSAFFAEIDALRAEMEAG